MAEEMSVSEKMKTILGDLSDAIAKLNELLDNKNFQDEEWQSFLARQAAQLIQIHGRLAYGFANHPAWKTMEKKSSR